MCDRRTAATSSGVPLRDNPSAVRPAFRPEIDDEVRALDHVEIVLDDDHRVAETDEPLQHIQQLVNVGEVQTRGGLVEDVNRSARRTF